MSIKSSTMNFCIQPRGQTDQRRHPSVPYHTVGHQRLLAAATGQEIEWDQTVKSEQRLVPEQLIWEIKLEPMGLALPGLTKLR